MKEDHKVTPPPQQSEFKYAVGKELLIDGKHAVIIESNRDIIWKFDNGETGGIDSGDISFDDRVQPFP